MRFGKLVLVGLIAMLVVYGIELFELWTFFVIFDVELKPIHYIIPIFIILIFLFSFGMKFCPIGYLYEIIFNISLSFLGIQLHLLLFMVIYHIINAITTPPIYASLLIVLPIPLMISLYGFINPWITKIDRIDLTCRGLGKTIKIAHLSDIHLGVHLRKNFCLKIVRILKELNPDVVVITGDFSDGSMKVKADWMEPFDTLTMPILYITGNHEQIHGKEDMLKQVALTKIQHIGNTCVEVCGVKFVGVDYEYNLKKRLNELNEIGELNLTNKSNLIVLLNHVPSITPEDLERYNIFLGLMGHTHGGQLFPLQIPAYFSNACFSGLYSSSSGKSHIYVSSGVGFATIPMRTFSRSVIGLITIKG